MCQVIFMAVLRLDPRTFDIRCDMVFDIGIF